MDDTISRAEHEEFRRRMEDEHVRVNKRLNALEEATNRFGDLVVSVEKLAVNMDTMSKELGTHNKKLEALETRDGEMWRKVVGYIVTAVCGIVIGFIFKQVGM